MILSKQKLQQEAIATGFRTEILEKVFLLMDMLSEFESYPQIKNKLVLKGGTALNLFHFNLPRLSVDIDLNYIGAIDRETMLTERENIYATVTAICQKRGLSLERDPKNHAGGKMIWRYPSALGQMGNLEIDLNFMYRVPLWPTELKSSCLVGSSQIHKIPVLDLHELAAGKLCALIDRQAGRDLFDAYHLLKKPNLDDKKLRLALVVYSGMNRKRDIRKIMPHDISFDIDEIKNRLIPLLNKNDVPDIKFISKWAMNIANQCQDFFSRLLPLKDNEMEFLDRLVDHGKIEPSLICDDSNLIENIKSHPALRWSMQTSKV
jgi:predicted nucleotidyltransferase component of viral defense system